MKKASLFNSLFLLLFIENFLFFTSHNALSMLPDYLSNLGASKGYIGFFMNINPLEMVLFVVFFSAFLNRLPKKKALFTGFSLYVFSMIGMFLFADNLIALFILRFTAAVSFVFGYTMHANLAFEIIPKEKRTGGIAIFGISGILSNPAGSILGETIIKYREPKYLFLLGAFFSIAALCILFFMKEPEHQEETISSSSFWNILSRKKMVPLFIIAVIFGGIFSSLAAFIPNFSKERLGFANLSIYFTAFSIVAIASRFFFSGRMDSLPKKKLMLLALSFMTAALALLVFLKAPWMLAAVGILYGFGHSVMFPVMTTSFIETGAEDERSLLNNTYIAFNTFGNVALTTLMGFIGDSFGTTSIFIIMAFMALICIFLTARFHTGTRPVEITPNE